MDTIPEFSRAARRIPAIAVGTIAGGRTDITGTGDAAVDPAGLCWEIGSITKVFTGILLADLALRSEVSLDDPIGRFLPSTETLPPPEVQPKLEDLATHTAGLPRLPLGMVRQVKDEDDPYAALTPEEVYGYLGPKTARPRRPRRRYSNFGVGLLGHLLARAAGTSYAALLDERVLRPLGLEETRVSGCGDDRSPVPGFRRGKPTPPWTFGALEGAGALRSTVPDLLRFAAACLDPPTGPAGAALRLSMRIHLGKQGPRGAMGLGWMIRTPPGNRRRAAWHNGGTYGAASFLAIGLDAPVAVAAVGNVGPGLFASPLDRAGWALFDRIGR
jgi:CubicO group peptidase (beta-lactamase class C family)